MSPDQTTQELKRLGNICRTSTRTDELNAAALQIIRLCAETGQVAPVRNLVETMSYKWAIWEGLRDTAAQGIDVWPMVKPLLPAHADRLDQVLGRILVKWPERLRELEPGLAMKTLYQAALWQRATLAPFAKDIIATYLRESGEVKEEAATPLRILATQPAPIPTEELEERLTTARAEESRLLAWVLVHERIKRGVDLESLLGDSRPLVRRGAYEALARSPERWARLLEGLLDSDLEVRKRLLEFARTGIEEGKPFDGALARRLVAAKHEEIDEFLSFVAAKYPVLKDACLEVLEPSKLRRTFEAKATRACARCRSLPHHTTWTHESDRPKALDQLESAGGLLRCPECWAHYNVDHWEEYDVNSKREEWTLTRLKLSELKKRPDFDQSHPRVATWEEALKEDLQHIEKSVRDEAKWELGE